MQVFTTIYLAETLRVNVQHVDETPTLETFAGVREFAEALSRKIAELERRDDPGRVTP